MKNFQLIGNKPALPPTYEKVLYQNNEGSSGGDSLGNSGGDSLGNSGGGSLGTVFGGGGRELGSSGGRPLGQCGYKQDPALEGPICDPTTHMLKQDNDPIASSSPPVYIGSGYIPDIPDPRDFVWGIGVNPYQNILGKTSCSPVENSKMNIIASDYPYLAGKETIPDTDRLLVDEFKPVEFQGHLNSCTAHAVIGIVEYLHRKQQSGRHLDLSRMFLYKNTRRLLGWTGNTGAYLRTTIKALAAFGVPPEDNWPYDSRLLDHEPDPYTFSFASNFKAIDYLRFDGYHSSLSDNSSLVKNIIAALWDGLPVAIGFPVPKNIDHDSGWVPKIEKIRGFDGGHAVLIVGYQKKTKGTPEAFIFRNSWGKGWGNDGFGFLPVEYVEKGIAVDCWTILDWKALGVNVFS